MNERYLNVGCGNTFHSDWTNVDLVSRHPLVTQHDLNRGLPYDDATFDAVYHSHVLEHLSPNQADKMLSECKRVLKPNGTLRIVVPDLEAIAQTYLETLRAFNADDQTSIANHRWMQLEMIDQMVRGQSGGQMGIFMSQENLPNREFIESRMGGEFFECIDSAADHKPRIGGKKNGESSIKKAVHRLRDRFAKLLLKTLYSKQAWSDFCETRFRSQGEIHRWMYDRVSLQTTLIASGFVNFKVCGATESRIQNFARFELDSKNGKTRKPDSLFVEATKPRQSNAVPIAA